MSPRVADAFIRRPGCSLPRWTRFAGGAGRCPSAEAGKRVPKRRKNPPMSCANVAEVQVDLGGRIHPTLLPKGCLAIAADLPVR